MTLREYLKSIADVLRNNLSMGEDEKINAQEFTSHIDTVAEANWESGYNSGYERGHDEGGEYHYNEGYSSGFNNGLMEGKQAEYDAFWDIYQYKGRPMSYLYAFAFSGWDDRTYNPKYPIHVLYNASCCFYAAYMTSTKVDFDISALSNNVANIFAHSSIETIPKLVVSENTAALDTAFTNCKSLKNLTMEGAYANNIDLHWSTLLSKASIENVINCLSTTASGKTATFSLEAVNNAFEGGSTGSEWLNLIQPKRAAGWSFALV